MFSLIFNFFYFIQNFQSLQFKLYLSYNKFTLKVIFNVTLNVIFKVTLKIIFKFS